MSDRDHGAALHQPVECDLNRFFRCTVERRSGFVEQQDGRVLQNCPGNRNTLTLATRKLDAAVANHRVVAFGHGLDEFGTTCFARGRHHFLRGSIGTAILNVFQDGAVKQ